MGILSIDTLDTQDNVKEFISDVIGLLEMRLDGDVRVNKLPEDSVTVQTTRRYLDRARMIYATL